MKSAEVGESEYVTDRESTGLREREEKLLLDSSKIYLLLLAGRRTTYGRTQRTASRIDLQRSKRGRKAETATGADAGGTVQDKQTHGRAQTRPAGAEGTEQAPRGWKGRKQAEADWRKGADRS